KGNFKPTLTVSNDQGLSSTAAAGQVRTDFGIPKPSIKTPTTTSTFRVGNTYTPTGSATDGSGAALSTSALTWQVWLFHINHAHGDLRAGLGGRQDVRGGGRHPGWRRGREDLHRLLGRQEGRQRRDGRLGAVQRVGRLGGDVLAGGQLLQRRPVG